MKHLLDNYICLGTHLFVSRILNWVLDKDALRIWHTEGVCLSGSRRDKLRGSDRYRWRALNFKPYRVMQTARGTRTSVGQGFNNEVVILLYFITQRCRSRLGEGWLGIPGQCDSG